MRIAKCVAPLQVHIMGNVASATITEGWEGDLDQVISETSAGRHTLATALGDRFNDTNFTVLKSKPAKAGAAAQPQE